MNYLDTDQWHDAMGFDFPQLADKPWGVLFDGGRDVAVPEYHAAMDVMRKLTKERERRMKRWTAATSNSKPLTSG